MAEIIEGADSQPWPHVPQHLLLFMYFLNIDIESLQIEHPLHMLFALCILNHNAFDYGKLGVGNQVLLYKHKPKFGICQSSYWFFFGEKHIVFESYVDS